MNAEHRTYTPLIFSVNGAMARELSKFHKYLADKIASKSSCMRKLCLSSNVNSHFLFCVPP